MKAKALALTMGILLGCAGTATNSGDDDDDNGSDAGMPDPNAPDAGWAPGAPDGGTPPEATCQAGFGACLSWNRVASCVDDGGSISWVEETCPDGSGCFQGECVVDQCSDECALGDSDCDLYEIGGSWRDPSSGKTHDRARLFEEWIRHDTESLFRNQIVSVKYTSSARSSVDSVYIGDSAMHTGIYLAAEARRLQATGSWRARRNVRSMVDTFHLLFNVSGDPGMLATSIFDAGDSKLRDWTDWDCSRFDRHCNVEYDGERYDYVGEPSRDMYMGPLIGLVAAYDALGPYDEGHRARIREDVVTWAQELMRKRDLPVRLVLNGGELPVQVMEARFFIPESADMVDGAVEVHFSTGDLSGGSIRGGQEFMPNPSVLFRQFDVLSWLPDVPRSSSALMVAATLRAALHVTEGVPEYAAERAEILDVYYNNTDQWGNVDNWIDLAASYDSDGSSDCDSHYFGVHIAWIGGYIFALLEDDPATKARLMSEVITPRLWARVQDHKNSFFTFAYAAVEAAIPSGKLADALEVVDDFPKPPRVRKSVDKRSEYGGSCSDEAVDIEDRPFVFLHWHSNPWETYDSGNTSQTYPGHDYLLAYWMARYDGHLADDTASRCLRKR